MNRLDKVRSIRQTLKQNLPSIGSWMQIPNTSVAEIMGKSGYDWIAIDLEHGAIGVESLPDLFRAIELDGTLPLVRIAQAHSKDCKHALDAGAGGVIVPMVESAEQLRMVRNACSWPPAGTRGVGFARANLFGKQFNDYVEEAQAPFLVAMIEHIHAIDNLENILQVKGLDAIMIGPYDLSASMGLTAKFDDMKFISEMKRIRTLCMQYRMPCGIHVVIPEPSALKQRIDEGYRFIAYSIDAVFLHSSAEKPAL